MEIAPIRVDSIRVLVRDRMVSGFSAYGWDQPTWDAFVLRDNLICVLCQMGLISFNTYASVPR